LVPSLLVVGQLHLGAELGQGLPCGHALRLLLQDLEEGAEQFASPPEGDFCHDDRAQKTGATTQSRSSRPGQGLNRTAPGRRPLRGVAGTASVETPRADEPAFGRFAEGSDPCSRMVRVVNGPGPARSLLWSKSPWSRKRRPRHAAGCPHLVMVLDR